MFCMGCYGNSELLRLFCSNVQDGHRLETLQTTSPPKQEVRLSRNLMGGIRVTWGFRIVESFSSSIQDGGHGGSLETLQTTSDSELLKAVGSDSPRWHNLTYHDQSNQGKRFLAHLGL